MKNKLLLILIGVAIISINVLTIVIIISNQGSSFMYIGTENKIKSKSTLTLTLNQVVDKNNYLKIDIKTDKNLIGVINYVNINSLDQKGTESFFIYGEGDNTEEFRQIIHNEESNYDKKITNITFENVENTNGYIRINEVEIDTITLPEDNLDFLSNDKIKIGVNTAIGGGLGYVAKLGDNLDQVKDNTTGEVSIGKDYRNLPNTTLMYDGEINLINAHDTGRMCQQSYYGIDQDENYTNGNYNNSVWPYNPVQGGDQYNNPSYIVDYYKTDTEIYVKTRALDWAKNNSITNSYMENWYTIEDNYLRVRNRFTDYSGYKTGPIRHQEIPAFYGVAPMSKFVSYRGTSPFTNDSLTYHDDLGWWAGTGPEEERGYFGDLSENWVAWVNKDDYGIGLYTPNSSYAVNGKSINFNNNFSGEAAYANPTTYTAFLASMKMESYKPFEYDYFIAIDEVSNLRTLFNNLDQTETNEDLLILQ